MQVVNWNLIAYSEALSLQEAHFQMMIEAKTRGESNRERNTLYLCEHPHVYTLGKHGVKENLLITSKILEHIEATFYRTDRGGDITYHGPGQLVGYPILDLESYNISLKEYIFWIEEAIIEVLQTYHIASSRLQNATGVWLDAELPTARKIAAIGVRASRFVTMHGFALNVNTNLEYFNHINPCGFVDKSVTSIAKELGKTVEINEIKELIANKIKKNIHE